MNIIFLLLLLEIIKVINKKFLISIKNHIIIKSDIVRDTIGIKNKISIIIKLINDIKI